MYFSTLRIGSLRNFQPTPQTVQSQAHVTMPSPTRTVLLVVMVLLLVDSVPAYLRQMDSVAEPHTQAQPVDTDGKPVHTARFLTGGGINGDTNSAMEERGYFNDKIESVAIKVTFWAAWKLQETPRMVLNRFAKHHVKLTEKTGVPWLVYVLKYRAKHGSLWAPDTKLIEWLSMHMTVQEMTVFFKSMEKNPKVKNLVENLQSALIKMG